nr:MAG TPA: organic radical activating enzyme [Caudoviricetes sp.]
MTKISINEIFGPTIQGEGVWTGCPAIFIRLNGCNLRCVFAGGSICDTPYTSHHAEKVEPMEIEEVIREIEEKMKGNTITDLVITGGEPLLQKEALGELLREFKNRHKEVKITVETNGSILPTETLFHYVSLWSVSPKLANSGCFEGTDIPEKERKMHHKNRYNPKALSEFVAQANAFQFKFVYTNDETEKMVDEVMDPLVKEFGSYVHSRVLIMPEGQTLSQINMSTEKALPVCYKRGWRFCDRLHIRVWGDKRGV